MDIYIKEGEKLLYEGFPEESILFLWFFKALFFSFIFSVLLVSLVTPILSYNFLKSLGEIYFINFLVFIIVLPFLVLYYAALRKTYKYYITNERIIFEGGIIQKKIKSIYYYKITDITIAQNIIEKVLGISRVQIHTASMGTRIPEIEFVGLRDSKKPQVIILKQLNALRSSKLTKMYSE